MFVSSRYVWTDEVTKQFLECLIHKRNIADILDALSKVIPEDLLHSVSCLVYFCSLNHVFLSQNYSLVPDSHFQFLVIFVDSQKFA